MKIIACDGVFYNHEIHEIARKSLSHMKIVVCNGVFYNHEIHEKHENRCLT